MPSPLGHALAGITAGLAIGPSGRDRRSLLPFIGLYGAAGAAADLDLLFGVHSGPTHGIGAAILAGLFAFALRTVWTRDRVGAGWRVGLAVGAACSTHTLLDWLGTDTSPPIGIMALWPFTDLHYESSLHLFAAISRRYWLAPEFFAGNLAAVARELLLLLPPLAIVLLWKHRKPSLLLPQKNTDRLPRTTDEHGKTRTVSQEPRMNTEKHGPSPNLKNHRVNTEKHRQSE